MLSQMQPGTPRHQTSALKLYDPFPRLGARGTYVWQVLTFGTSPTLSNIQSNWYSREVLWSSFRSTMPRSDWSRFFGDIPSSWELLVHNMAESPLWTEHTKLDPAILGIRRCPQIGSHFPGPVRPHLAAKKPCKMLPALPSYTRCKPKYETNRNRWSWPRDHDWPPSATRAIQKISKSSTQCWQERALLSVRRCRATGHSHTPAFAKPRAHSPASHLGGQHLAAPFPWVQVASHVHTTCMLAASHLSLSNWSNLSIHANRHPKLLATSSSHPPYSRLDHGERKGLEPTGCQQRLLPDPGSANLAAMWVPWNFPLHGKIM